MATFNGSGIDGNNVLIDPTGLSVVTSTDVQGAIAELDAGGGGGADLAATLVLGNVTGGTDVELSAFPATGTMTVSGVPAVGDQVEVAGTTLTGVAGAPAAGQFQVDAGSPELVAQSIIAGFTGGPIPGTVTATTDGGGVITYTATAQGLSGNSITLSVPTNVGGALAVSGATLTGGSVDQIRGEDAAVASGLPGMDLALRPGNGDGAGVDGATVIGPGHAVTGSPQALVAGGGHTLVSAPYASVFGNNNTFTGTGHDWSFMAGRNNTINGTGFNPYVTISGGSGNYVGGYAYGATIGGGFGNAIYSTGGNYASGAFLAGRNNRIYTVGYSGAYNSVLLGSGNRLYGGQSSFLIGLQNRIVNASYSLSGGNGSDVYANGSIGFGFNAFVASRADSSAVFGRNAVAANVGALVWGSASRSLNTLVVTNGRRGAAQPASYALGTTTQNATPQQMTTNGSTSVSATNRLILQADKVYTFRALVSAYQTGGAAGTPGDTAGWVIEGLIKRVGTTTTLVSSVGAGNPTFTDAGSAGWNVAVAADDTNEALVFTVTGEASKNIVWSARIDASEAGDPVLP